jgi:hypothetical protein
MKQPLENIGESSDQHEQPSALLTDGLRELLTWIWLTPKLHTNDVHAAFTKFLAISATIRPELFDAQTYEELGRGVGISRAALSKAAVRFTRRFGLKFRRQQRQQNVTRKSQ